jgi:hypothetical protein
MSSNCTGSRLATQKNDSCYHFQANRVLPAFIAELDEPFAEILFKRPNTAYNEQNLNSTIVNIAHNESLPLPEVRKGKNYQIAGIAYDEGGMRFSVSRFRYKMATHGYTASAHFPRHRFTTGPNTGDGFTGMSMLQRL